MPETVEAIQPIRIKVGPVTLICEGTDCGEFSVTGGGATLGMIYISATYKGRCSVQVGQNTLTAAEALLESFDLHFRREVDQPEPLASESA